MNPPRVIALKKRDITLPVASAISNTSGISRRDSFKDRSITLLRFYRSAFQGFIPNLFLTTNQYIQIVLKKTHYLGEPGEEDYIGRFIYGHIPPKKHERFPQGLILTPRQFDNQKKQLGKYFPHVTTIPNNVITRSGDILVDLLNHYEKNIQAPNDPPPLVYDRNNFYLSSKNIPLHR